MIPTTLAGVLLFVALLAPGFIYLERRERRHAGIPYTVLRETSVIITASLATLAASLVVVGLVRVWLPGQTPDVGRYVREGNDHLKSHYLEATLWCAGTLALACLLAWYAAIPPAAAAGPVRSLPRFGPRLADWLERRRGGGPIAQVSGWTVAFSKRPETEHWLDVVLLDGTSIHGMKGSHSTQIDESADRDLVLAAPLSVRPPGGNWTPLPLTGTIVVSAARISYFAVQYVKPQAAHSKLEPSAEAHQTFKVG